ncbi:hypothetical protein EBZ39_11370 [bacterium]|nr:hypothetical protein [bacterium]
MCLLIHQKPDTQFDDEFLASVYAQNSDGLGIMYADRGALVIAKALPRNAEEFAAFYREHAEGRECVVHARMQTHGDIDLANCHPYNVTDRVALAHNGVLSTGNDADKTKSDTWHFVENIIRPAVLGDESIILRDSWQRFIGSAIGSSNKFGLMTAAGDVVIINRASGVEFRGAWLSNTYAWPAAKYNMAPSYSTYWSNAYADEYDWQNLSSTTAPAIVPKKKPEPITRASLPSILRAARNSYIRGTLSQWIHDAPAKALALLTEIEEHDAGETVETIKTDGSYAETVIADWFEMEGLDPRLGAP